MTKYLDQNGLAYFWTKIKAWLSSHAPVKYFGQNWVEDTGNDYALVVGDGVDENNPENAMAVTNDGKLVKFANGMSAITAPANTTYHNMIEQYDDDGNRRMILQVDDFANGKQGVALRAQRLVNNATVYNGFDMTIDSNGDRYIELNDKEAWWGALNELDAYPIGKGFIVKDTRADIKKANNDLTSNVYPNIELRDGTGKAAARLEAPIQTDGQLGFYLMAKQWDTSGNQVGSNKGIKFLVDKSGAGTWSVSEPQSFRKALGLGQSNGAFPLTIAQGGTGQTGIELLNVSDVITPASGITIVDGTIAKWGKVMFVRMKVKKNSAISVPASGNLTDVLIGTYKAAYTPYQYHFAFAWIDGLAAVLTSNSTAGEYAKQLWLVSISPWPNAWTLAANTEWQLQDIFLLP